MHQPVIAIFRIRIHALAMKPRKHRGRARPVKTLIVIKNSALQRNAPIQVNVSQRIHAIGRTLE
jgi:hypothetical protein